MNWYLIIKTVLAIGLLFSGILICLIFRRNSGIPILALVLIVISYPLGEQSLSLIPRIRYLGLIGIGLALTGLIMQIIFRPLKMSIYEIWTRHGTDLWIHENPFRIGFLSVFILIEISGVWMIVSGAFRFLGV